MYEGPKNMKVFRACPSVTVTAVKLRPVLARKNTLDSTVACVVMSSSR